MTDYWAEVRKGSVEQPIPRAPQTDYWQELRQGPGGPRPRGKSDLEKPSIKDDLSSGASFGTTLRASLAPDTKDQIKRYATERGIPVERYGVVKEPETGADVIVYADPSGQYVRETPSVGAGKGIADKFMRAGRYVASQFGPSIPMIAGGAAVPLTGGGPWSIPAAAGAAASADVARQSLDRLLAGENPADIDLANAALHGLAEGTGSGLALGAARTLARNPLQVAAYDRASAMSPTARAEAEAMAQEARARGIDLSTGQATELPSILAQERQLGRFPETADMMSDFAKRQRTEQVPRAFREQLDKLTPPQGRESGIQSFRQGASDIVKQAEKSREKRAEALYEQAFAENPVIKSPVVDRILETPAGRKALREAAITMRNDLKPVGPRDTEMTEAARMLEEIGRLPEGTTPKEGIAAGLSLRSLDYVKRELTKLADQATAMGDNDTARIIGNRKRELTKELDRLDATKRAGPKSLKPGPGVYQQARQMWGDDSDAIDSILKGGVGFVNDMTGRDRVDIVNKVFAGRNLLPEEIGRMRKRFEDAGKISDWNAGIRVHLEDSLDKALAWNSKAESGNVPGKIVADLWGPDGSPERARFRAAIGDPKVADGFETLFDILGRAAKSLPEGSPTATDMPAMGAQVSRGAKFLGKAISPGSYLNLGTEIIEGVAAARDPARRRKMAALLLDSPTALRELRNLRILSPTGRKAAQVAGQILVNAGVIGLGGRSPAGAAPSIQDQQLRPGAGE